jgi:hypothetical protein
MVCSGTALLLLINNDDDYPDDGDSKRLWNVWQYLQEYMVQHTITEHLHTRPRENLESHLLMYGYNDDVATLPSTEQR